MLHAPLLLLLDEPDTGLDQEGQALIDALLAEHCERGGSALFTTHQLERALQLSHTMVILSKGRIAYQHESAALTVAALQQIMPGSST
jgi:ABC-type multidrug transport system ATPase subunit